VDCLYSKAVTEPNFSILYADLALKLAKTPVHYQLTKHTNFRTLVIKRCQNEFEHKQRAPIIPDDLPLEKKFELEEFGNKIKNRNNGAVVFIGELFLKTLLNVRVMYFCFDNLLTDNPETSDVYDLENFNKLMTTIGKSIDEDPKNKESLVKYFSICESLSKSKTIIPRLRFKYLDLVDLRKRGWQLKKNSKR